jgi:hypothetical protein
MKTNPFYALSVSAMLLGCWLLSEALHLQAGRLGGLLVLMAVLQLYEVLLVGLGTHLVRAGRAPRDGVTVLLLESLFLLDAPLLGAECVTADARVGTAVALAAVALALAKLAWVRRTLPDVLSRRAAVLLAAQSAFVLAVPVAAAHLAWARLFGPRTLWLFWWATFALPFARRSLGEESLGRARESSSGLVLWTWTPAAMVLLHLWAVGYIHSTPFQPAFLAPLLLGLAATAERERLARMLALPALAVTLSLGQKAALGFGIGAEGPFVSPLRLALLAVAATWGYLAWRHCERRLAVLAAVCGVAGLLHSSSSRLWHVVGRVLAFVDAHRPRDAFGWGVLAVIAAFVLLAAGARRSLADKPGAPRQPRGGQRPVEQPADGR